MVLSHQYKRLQSKKRDEGECASAIEKQMAIRSFVFVTMLYKIKTQTNYRQENR